MKMTAQIYNINGTAHHLRIKSDAVPRGLIHAIINCDSGRWYALKITPPILEIYDSFDVESRVYMKRHEALDEATLIEKLGL
jgi:hypothetical protein